MTALFSIIYATVIVALADFVLSKAEVAVAVITVPLVASGDIVRVPSGVISAGTFSLLPSTVSVQSTTFDAKLAVTTVAERSTD